MKTKVKIELIYKEKRKAATIKFTDFDSKIIVEIVNKIIQYLIERFVEDGNPAEEINARLQCNISMENK